MFFPWALITFTWCATSFGAVTFRAVPLPCTSALLQIKGDAPDGQSIIDWEPWAFHLRELGYDDSYVPAVMAEGVPGIDQILKNVRDLIGPGWTWRDGFTEAEAKQMKYYPKGLLPFEYLVHVKGFDPRAAIEGRLTQNGMLKLEEIKWLARRAPFWVAEMDTLLDVLIYRMTGTLAKVNAHRWLRRAVSEDRRVYLKTRILDHLAKGHLDTEALFTAVDHLPVREFSEIDRRRLRTAYLLPDPTAFESAAIKAACYGLNEGGDCREMAFGHLSALLSRQDLVHHKAMIKQKPVVVRVNGRPVGLIKTHGDPSMLALVTVRNTEGNLTLVRGGIYRISRTLWDLPSREIRPRRWLLVDVEELKVTPVGPVLNPYSWMSRNATILAILMGGDVVENMKMLLHEIVASGEYAEGDLGRLRKRYHRRVWANILTRIDAVRTELERSTAHVPRLSAVD